MGAKRPVVSPEDQALFHAAVAGATPLGQRDRVPPVPVPARAAVRVAALPPEQKLVVEGDGGRYAARGPGVSRAQIAQLRAGKVHVDETLDLHGDTALRAIQRLREFLAGTAGLRRCVLIVHGKGTHSDHGAPLREAVLGELLGALSGYVHAFAIDAGEGATFVLLRGGR